MHNMSKSSECRHNNEVNNEQGCGGREYSNPITKNGSYRSIPHLFLILTCQL